MNKNGPAGRGPWRSLAATAFLFLAALLFWSPAAVSRTYDEKVDDAIVRCYLETRNPFSCTTEPSQTRLTHYIPAIARAALPGIDPLIVDRLVSAVFVLGAVWLAYGLARRTYGDGPATVFMFLAATSSAVLASGRTSLTHSNAIFLFFTVAAIAAAEKHAATRRRTDFLASAVFFGLSVASNLLGVFTAAYFLLLTVRQDKDGWSAKRFLAFLGVAVAAFFIAAPFYLVPANLSAALVEALGVSGSYPQMDYFMTGAHQAPFWYSALLFLVRLSPWWALLFFAYPPLERNAGFSPAARKFGLHLWAFIVFWLIVKSAFLKYDAPHHQYHIQLLALVLSAAALVGAYRAAATKALRRTIIAAAAAGFAAQGLLVWIFYPNMLFFGAQYGPRFIGEFIGPAAVQCQGMTEVADRARELLSEGAEVLVIRSMCWRDIEGIALTGARPGGGAEPNRDFHIILEGIFAFRMNLTPEIRRAISDIGAACRLERSYLFPLGFPAYLLYDCPAGAVPGSKFASRLEPAE